MIVGVYVDDLLIASSSEAARLWFMEQLSSRFPVNPNATGVITFDTPGLVLSMNVRYDRDRGILQLDQVNSIEALAKRYDVIGHTRKSLPLHPKLALPKLSSAEVDVNTYLSIIGSCLHLAQVSRPDIAYAVSVLSRHSATPGQEHLTAALNLVNYLFYSKDLYIEYQRSEHGNNPHIFEKGEAVPERPQRKTIEERLIASTPQSQPNGPDLYIDADYAGDVNTRRSTSGWISMMNSGPINWGSRLQKLCAQSSAESEIYAVTESAKEAVHVKLLCEETGIRPLNIPLTIWEDNNACLQMAHGIRGSKAAKHFAVRLRFLNELVHDNTVEFARIDTKDQLADGFTKQLPGPAFFEFRNRILHSPNF